MEPVSDDGGSSKHPSGEFTSSLDLSALADKLVFIMCSLSLFQRLQQKASTGLEVRPVPGSAGLKLRAFHQSLNLQTAKAAVLCCSSGGGASCRGQ